MAVCNSSLSFLSPFNLYNPIIAREARYRRFFICSSGKNAGADSEPEKITKRLSEQSSWETKDSEGKGYLYRLGTESDNMNIAVGARGGVVDDLFTGNFLGRECIETSPFKSNEFAFQLMVLEF